MEMPSTTTSTTTAEKLHHSRRKILSGDLDKLILEPEDFSDVFGGPPLTMSRQYHGGYINFLKSSFYEEIFQPPVKVEPEGNGQGNGRVLQEFNIPKRGGGRKSDQRFFSNILGWGKEEVRRLRTRSGSRSGSKSKERSSSVSVLSSEDLSPVQTVVCGGHQGGDDELPLFASTLRSLNVPRGRKSIDTVPEEHQRQQDMPTFSWNDHPFYNAENVYYENIRSSHFGYCPRNSSPTLEPNLYCNRKVSADDLEPNSSSSAVSSICQDQETMSSRIQDEMMQEQGVEDDEDESEDEIMNSYVIEINSEDREGTDDAIGVEEAIAWAKEMFRKHSTENSWSMKVDEEKQSAEAEEMVNGDQSLEEQKIDEHGSTEAATMEMEQLDENVQLWSTGKEADIRLLLSTLHHILWPDSGWLAISITSLRERSQVKKAYQKARLCLHPDKLQQRGATLRQTHVAERVFFILQEAWAAFISKGVTQR